MYNKQGRIIALFRVNTISKELERLSSLSLRKEGIEGDKHYGKNPERMILLSSLKSYQIVKEALQLHLPEGYLGENILVDTDLYHLLPGTRLRIGEKTYIEITQNCTLCSHLGTLDKRIPKLLKNDRGIFAKTVKEGIIQEGDIIEWI